MKNKMLTLMILLLSLSLCVLPQSTFGAQDERQERFSRRLDIGPDGSLSLANISGDIIVRGDSGAEVQIEAVKRVHRARSQDDITRQLDAVVIEVSHTGTRARVRTRYPDDRDRRRRDINVTVDFQVTVPYGTEVSVSSVSGEVEVQDVNGELEAQSVSGNVTVARAENLVLAKSVSGSVDIESVSARNDLELSSVSGDVEVRGVRVIVLDVSSVSGEVRVTEASCERASLESVSGEIRYEGTLAHSGRYEFQSHSGDVVVTIPGEIGFELEAETFSGDIETDFPLTVTSLGRQQRRVSGVSGDGSAYIEATTFSGSVRIRQR